MTVRARRMGWGLTAVVGLFLGFDAVMKLVDHPEVAKTMTELGVPTALDRPLGAVLAACLALFLAPRTAPIGAVLLTGFLGGAVMVHARVGDPLASHTLFPVWVGALAWAGLYLRDERVRRLVTNPNAVKGPNA